MNLVLSALFLPAMLDAAGIAELLQPFVADSSPGAPSRLSLPGWKISSELAGQLQTYLDLLLRWNARVNLTAVRDPEQIVTRHFGESLFTARVLRDAGAISASASLADVGSGAGFPGIPIKLFAPELRLTLIESQNKKATFLREVVRALNLNDAEVYSGRAENWGSHADVVTLRAVEKFTGVLPVAAGLVAERGTLCLLIGEGQAEAAQSSLPSTWHLGDSTPIPLSDGRVVVLERRND